ncbi:MAG: metallophosphoesterase family protein [Candidatus Zixiibacteriota bacterium]
MIYVISDTHIPERMTKLPRKFLDKIKPDDVILHAGDFINWETLKELKSLATLYAVRGNMDHLKIKDSLDKKKRVSLQGKKVGLYHGSGLPFGLGERVYKEFEVKPDVIIFGHSHLPYNRKKENTLLFNPGSLSGNLMSPFATYGVLTIDGNDVWGEIFELEKLAG